MSSAEEPGAPRVRGAKTLTAMLPSGRIRWLQVEPELAPATEINRLAYLMERSDARQARAFERLSTAVAADTKRLTQAQVRGDRRLQRQVVAGDAKLDRRVSKEFGKRRAELKREVERQWTVARRLERRALWDQLVVASSAPLFAAYGQRSDPFSYNNLALALSLAVWLVGDDAVELITSRKGGEPHYVRDLDVWSYISPFANLLTGWWLLHDAQHERFITGATDQFARDPAQSTPLAAPAIPLERIETYVAQVDVSALVAPDHVLDFQSFARVPALGLILSKTFGSAWAEKNARLDPLKASVERGVLTLTVTARAQGQSPSDTPLLTSIQVAWLSDTREP